jgi:hypothetical protein
MMSHELDQAKKVFEHFERIQASKEKLATVQKLVDDCTKKLIADLEKISPQHADILQNLSTVQRLAFDYIEGKEVNEKAWIQDMFGVLHKYLLDSA